MNNRWKISLAVLFMSFIASIQSCTNLDEDVYNQIPQDQFGLNEEQLEALIGPLYGGLSEYPGRFMELNSVADDQIAPTRGGDWKDGDRWRRYREHNWSPTYEDDVFNGLWTWIYNNVTAINQQLANPGIKEAQVVAELRTLRAFYHYLAMDTFGRAIIADQISAESPGQKTRAEMYAFIEKELTEALPDLSQEVTEATYGRLNQYVAQMMLAKLYLNAQVYAGTPQWAKALAACDVLINSGKYSLATDFFSNFSVNNEDSPETIFAIPLDKTKKEGMSVHLWTLHYLNQLTYNLGSAPWNGLCTTEEFYNTFEDADIRKQMWLVGTQYSSTGEVLMDDSDTLAFTVKIPAFEMPAGTVARAAGARSVKYEVQRNNASSNQDNDFVVYRLADVYLMRAEAQFRLGNMADALTDINHIRTARNVSGFTTLDSDKILAERGRELAWEYHRRQDLIRFGVFGKPWQFKPASPVTHELFPIPVSQIALNANLTQNPGY
jgi:hypothetical protein